MLAKDAIYHSDLQRMSGTPVFVGSRVPIKNLFDYLAGGDTLDEFFADFPTVKHEQARAILELATTMLCEEAVARRDDRPIVPDAFYP